MTKQISDLTEKTSPALGDQMPVDEVTTNASKKLLMSSIFKLINLFTAKTSLTGADEFVINDSAASNAPKKITWTNILTALNGDKGDITVSGSGDTWTIDNDVVTFAKFQNITDARLLGRSAGSDGDMQHITVGTGLSLSAGALAGATASDTVVGTVELATTAETNTGTDATRAVTPDGLAGSYAGTASVSSLVQSGTITIGDGKVYILMPAKTNGMNLVGVACTVVTTSSSGTPTVQVARGRQANATTAHAFVDMLSTRVTIDANEYSSADATTAAVIDGANDDIATGDLLRVDIDVTGTGTASLYIYLEFRLP